MNRLPCHLCAKTFSGPGGLAFHLFFDHDLVWPIGAATRDRNWKCVCGGEFPNLSSLGEHLVATEDIPLHFLMERIGSSERS